jgi:hypothetical protein
MMPIKAVVQNLDEVEGRLRVLYVAQDDGTFALDADVENHPAVAPLRNAYDRVATEVAGKRSEADELKKVVPTDFSIEEWNRLKAQDAELDVEGAAAIERLNAEHTEQMAERDRKLLVLDRFLHRHLVEAALTAALAEVGVAPKFMQAVVRLLSVKCVIVERLDGPIAVVRQKSGDWPVKKFVGRWALSDEGRAFLERPNSIQANGGFKALIAALK